MSNDKLKSLLHKYRAGETTRSEELYLQQHSFDIQAEEALWLQYVSAGKKSVPADLQQKAWQKINQQKVRRKQQIRWGMGIAATLLLTFYGWGWQKQQRRIQQNQMVLNEALQMFHQPEDQKAYKQVYYEDEFMIIYHYKKQTIKQ